MFSRKVRPADEEFSDITMLIAFSAVWYGLLIEGAIRGKTEWIHALFFMIFGLLPLHTIYSRICRVRMFRKKRREAIQRGQCYKGVIRRVAIERVPYSGRRGTLHYRTMYYLLIDKEENEYGVSTEIKSQGYRFPVPYYLKSPEVTLYVDASGWNWYVEDLKCSRWRTKQSILELEDDPAGSYSGQKLFQIVFILGLIYIFWQGIT